MALRYSSILGWAAKRTSFISRGIILFCRLLLITSLLSVFISTQSVAADTTGSGNVVVSAVIAPVRYIVVNNNKIVEIISNTDQDVTPTVELSKLGGKQISINQEIKNQYVNIMSRHKNLKHYGIIYMYQPQQNKSATSPSQLRISKVYMLFNLFK
jgi:hypothetical protein